MNTANFTLGTDIPRAIRRRLARALKHERKRFSDIVEARRPGYYQLRYVTSLDCLTVAAYEAWKSYPLDRRPPASMIVETAEKVSALRGSDEPVIVRIKRKGLSGYRLICAFGPENKTLQYVVAGALKARAELHPSQYAINRGRPAAVLALRDALLAENCYAAELDIRNCFGSFDGEELSKTLPLPRRLIETVVLSKNYNLQLQPISQKEITKLKYVLSTHSEDDAEDPWKDDLDPDLGHPLLDLHAHTLPLDFFVEEARRGLPQGSALSSLTCEALLSPAIAHVSSFGAVTNYADNIVLHATTKADLASRIETLRCSLEELPGGPLPVKTPVIYEPGQSVAFLGYVLKPKNGQVIIEPSEKNLTTFRREFKRRWNRVLKASAQERSQRIESLRQYVRTWSASFSLWHGAIGHREKHLAMVKELTQH